MATLLELSIAYALVCVLVAMLLCAARLLIGPSAHDRVLALDTLWMVGMVLALALVGFVSTVAMAKFLMRGEIIE